MNKSQISVAVTGLSLLCGLGVRLPAQGVPGAAAFSPTNPIPHVATNRPSTWGMAGPWVATTNPTPNVVTNRPVVMRPLTLAWSETAKEYTAKLGETNAVLTFQVTNVSPAAILVRNVRASCGCTVPQLPRQPWVLAPGEGGALKVTVDLRGKFGTLNKFLSVDTSAGFQLLSLRVHIPTPAPIPNNALASRGRNIVMAMADRQAVFKAGCVQCHVTPGRGKFGQTLYVAACGICHDSPHRATMVPDLRTTRHPATADYWRHWIAVGKVKSLMPAFALAEGGPLTETQINSLVDYLLESFPPPAAASGSTNPSAKPWPVPARPRPQPVAEAASPAAAPGSRSILPPDGPPPLPAETKRP